MVLTIRFLLFQLKNKSSFYLLPRVDEERLLLLFDVADPREEELLPRCTLEVLERVERLTAAGELLRWLVCCTLRDEVRG